MYREECEKKNLTDMDHRDAFLSDTEAHCLKGSGMTLVLVTFWRGTVGIIATVGASRAATGGLAEC